ncbi:nucleotidyltransferase domain-containing protein [Patescibacteria group bacterium]|nr:nucleotidyltransferase domain-containing protein [Patescibacteria group bacterium]
MLYQKELKKITKAIVEKYKPEKIILFGSLVWGKPNKDSDVDLFIIKKTSESIREFSRKIDGSIFPRPFPLDIIVSTPQQVKKRIEKEDFFIREIFKKGEVLYEK